MDTEPENESHYANLQSLRALGVACYGNVDHPHGANNVTSGQDMDSYVEMEDVPNPNYVNEIQSGAERSEDSPYDNQTYDVVNSPTKLKQLAKKQDHVGMQCPDQDSSIYMNFAGMKKC